MTEIHNNEKSFRKKEKAIILNGFTTNERGISKPFKIYDLDGNFIKEYNSAKEYSELNNVKARGTLSRILKRRNLVYKNNYIILFSNDNLIIKDIIFAKNKTIKSVDVFDLNNNFIQRFKTVNKCANFLKCKDAEIRMCCLGKRSRIKNFITKYTIYE